MKVLVTGGAGFLGKAIIKQLLREEYEVHSFSRGHYPELEKMGVSCFTGDLYDYNSVLKAAKNCDAIIHTAAKAGVWGSYESYYNTNVKGTENIIRACKDLDISRLVYTSSPSVIFDGRDQNNMNESQPYPHHYLAHYPRTKAIAEKKILEENSENLMTIALRPHLIWGPNDPHLVPRILQRAKQGKLKLVGKEDKLVDSIYIENAAYAHILALKKLQASSPIQGKAFFITNQEPLTMKDLINRILKAGNLPAIEKRVPSHVAYFAGAVLEFIYKLFRIKEEPVMTRFVAKQLATSHWYDPKSARENLGYRPIVTQGEGFIKLSESLESSRPRSIL